MISVVVLTKNEESVLDGLLISIKQQSYEILETDGAGFAGSHVCEYYKKQGAKVVAYDNLTKFEPRGTGYSIKRA